ncbi:MAG: hypothetical protein AAF985_21400, partial [Bacteroidota bacterium]
ILAQAPQSFNYQGIARDLSGNPITNQSIELRISILRNSPNGDELYKETFSSTTTDLGLFNLQIGTGMVVNGVFENINWGEADHFLQIELDENGGNNYQLIGTSQLLSVPYALYAESGGEWRKFNDGIFYNNGSVRIGQNNGQPFNSIPTLNLFGDNNPDNFILRLEQGGEGVRKGIFFGSPLSNSSARVFLENNVFSIGRANSISNNKMLNFNISGNIGINETDPKSKLHIKEGDVYIEEVSSGIIMKSPNGLCWRITINDNGELVPTSIVCPN